MLRKLPLLLFVLLSFSCALIAYLRAEAILFLVFRAPIPGVATGPHIHVGYRLSRSYAASSTDRQKPARQKYKNRQSPPLWLQCNRPIIEPPTHVLCHYRFREYGAGANKNQDFDN